MIFSIIVPVCNAAEYLPRLFRSVDALRIEPGYEIELLLIVNGSTDDSEKICREYQAQHYYADTYTYDAIGPFEARRKGMKKAKGDYFVFSDADDELLEDSIYRLYEALGKTEGEEKPDIILYNAETSEKPGKKKFSFPFREGVVYSGDDKRVFYETMCRGDSLNAMWNKAISRRLADWTIVDDEIIKSAPSLSHGEDLIQAASLIDGARSIIYLDKILYRYIINKKGLTGGYHPEYIPHQEQAWDVFEKYMDKWHMSDMEKLVDERKALTCTIGVKGLIYSDLSREEKSYRLKELMGLGFYREFGRAMLPDWASEEDVFVHELQCKHNAAGSLLMSGLKSDFKRYIKKRILKNGI